MLKLKSEPYTIISDGQIEVLCKKYGHKVELIPDNELHNGESTVPFIRNLYDTNLSGNLELFKNGDKACDLGLFDIIYALIALEEIPLSNYIIDHSW